MRQQNSVEEIIRHAQQIRRNTIISLHSAGSGHPGGALSMVEIIAVLYFYEMNISPDKPEEMNRDRFVLSKGHAAPAYYAALAERGYFEKSALTTLRKMGSMLQGHPDMKKVPGVDMSTGSLGQGISAACGMAHYAKKTGKDYRVYCIIGDGEMQEGQVWEAFMSAGHFKLDNLVVFLDNNNLQIDGRVDEVMSIYPVKEKLQAFGWHVEEADGHNVKGLIETLDRVRQVRDQPAFIIGKTTKGKGVSFMENQAGWHGAAINDEQFEQAMKELGEACV
ncbi:MAG: transketolase [Blautia sp.]|jgi:transketolase|uniref:transketolase n=1 Tax=Blautia sp. TaxID=1955243 RepID=UPI003D8E94AB